MKKAIIVLLVAAMLLAVGCNGKKDTGSHANSQVSSVVSALESELVESEEFESTPKILKTDEDLVSVVAESLGVPKDVEYTYKISKEFYWDAGEVYFKNVEILEDGKLIASASVDSKTGELLRNIWKYGETP